MEQVAPLPQLQRGVGSKVQGPLGVGEAAGEAAPNQLCCHACSLQSALSLCSRVTENYEQRLSA